ncbi:MAG: hypothetical protein RLZZ252_1266, partial [Bacteroidota bacterium]
MEIPFIGLCLIICIVLVALIRPLSTVYLCAFLTPFSGVSIINIPEIEFSFVPFAFSAGVWFFIYLIVISSSNSKTDSSLRGQGSLNMSMALFIIVTGISLMMPVVIDGRDQYMGAGILGHEITYAIKFSPWHLIH